MKTYREKGFAEKGGMDESTRQRIQSKVTLAVFSFLVFTRILDPKVISVVVLHGAAAKKEVVCRRRSELRPSLDEYKVAAI